MLKKSRWLVPLSLIALLLGATFFAQAQDAQESFDVDIEDHATTLSHLVGRIIMENALDTDVIRAIRDSGDPLYIAPMLDIAFFVRQGQFNALLLDTLASLTGQPPTDEWQGYFEWAGENNIALPEGYGEFKGRLLGALLDPEFERFFPEGVMDTARINLVEAVWGGVTVDGIPSLVNARQITPEEALQEGETLTQFCREGDCAYPAPDEYVFGISIDGDSRAYPLRLLNWHEMFNDVIGHTPMYDAPNGEQVCNFRAPTTFSARAVEGEQVFISGESAGCPESGWVDVDAIEWLNSDWDTVQPLLPSADNMLAMGDGIVGSVKGKPVMLAYCTLCGSGILYDTTIPNLSYVSANGETVELGETVLEFGSTGMLMRSNKLMYDRNTDTVWNAITGEPAFGLLATSDVVLDLLPVVVIDWASWLEQHPDTSVLSLDTGFPRNYTNGGAYEDYFNNPNFIMFPVWQQDTSEQDNKEMIFALTIDGVKKAYPLADIVPLEVVNDRLAGQDVVIIAQASPERDFFEPGGAAVRAYATDGITFSAGEEDNTLVSAEGELWQVTESALVNAEGELLPRLPGHLAFWFGWYSFNPDTLVYAVE
jgi:hypothetical protein